MPDRGSMTAGFYVIRHTTMPSILTEGGFVTNSNDASYLQDPSFIEQAARAHAAALAAAFDDITENGGNGGGDEDTPDTPDEENWSGQILQEGSRGPLVRDLQQRLLDLGYDLGTYGADGIYGPVTREAVRSFQQDAGITVDGIAGPETYRAMEEVSGGWSGQILQEGSRGPLVRDLQQRLLDLGYDLGSYGADGIYGPVTREAVRSFQQDAGITVDGIAGPETYRAMEEVSGGWSGQILQEGSRGPLVRDLQQRLLDLGYDIGTYGADGIYGPVTREAVRSFQQDAGVTVDGIAGPATHRALQEAERQG
ncbi:peptidoglycan-binding protein [Thalassobacillus sp. C254]|uniref:peptidoglycan-binding protein n=1 Tax=Thalassobacillus sp. C254 TaxID=1225341 RepID=UPI0006CF5EC2|nr:peptidoglycan-binding protein [Thalassobacillus sp. C254]